MSQFLHVDNDDAKAIAIPRGYFFFLVKDRNLFHRADTIGNIFTRGCAPLKYSVYFMLLTLFWEKLYQNPVQFFSVIPRGVPLLHSNAITILRQAPGNVR